MKGKQDCSVNQYCDFVWIETLFSPCSTFLWCFSRSLPSSRGLNSPRTCRSCKTLVVYLSQLERVEAGCANTHLRSYRHAWTKAFCNSLTVGGCLCSSWEGRCLLFVRLIDVEMQSIFLVESCGKQFELKQSIRYCVVIFILAAGG